MERSIFSLKKDKGILLFVLLAGVFITNTFIAEFVGIKIFSLEKTLGIHPIPWSFFGISGEGFNLTAGVLIWPVVFIVTDVINEYFGAKKVKFLSYMTIGLILYAFFMVYGTILLEPNDWWKSESGINLSQPDKSISNMNAAFSKVMGQGMWIIVGSMVAFLVGQILDVAIFHKIKKLTGDKNIWMRATGSTLVSQFVDSYVVLIIAFYVGSDWELSRVLAIGTVNYIYKFGVAILVTPLIYLAHYLIDNWLGTELADALKSEAAR